MRRGGEFLHVTRMRYLLTRSNSQSNEPISRYKGLPLKKKLPTIIRLPGFPPTSDLIFYRLEKAFLKFSHSSRSLKALDPLVQIVKALLYMFLIISQSHHILNQIKTPHPEARLHSELYQLPYALLFSNLFPCLNSISMAK